MFKFSFEVKQSPIQRMFYKSEIVEENLEAIATISVTDDNCLKLRCGGYR